MKNLKRQRFVDDMINKMHAINQEAGHLVISIETLKMIMVGYVKKYKSPKVPGTINKKIALKIKENDHQLHKLPTLYVCQKCNTIKPKLEMKSYTPPNKVDDFGSGECKKCHNLSDNVVRVDFKRKR